MTGAPWVLIVLIICVTVYSIYKLHVQRDREKDNRKENRNDKNW